MEVSELAEGKKVINVGWNYKGFAGKIITTIPRKGKVLVTTNEGVINMKVKHLQAISSAWEI